MDILWHGQTCFEIHTSADNGKENKKIIIDPYFSDIGLKPISLNADIIILNHDYNNPKTLKLIKEESFLVNGQGEYESQGVIIKGIDAQGRYFTDKEEGKTTIYYIETEGIKLCHLGSITQKQLNPEQIEAIDGVDILMVPVGGGYTLDAEGAHRIVNQIEPKIVIPMNYQLPKLKKEIREALEPRTAFLKAMGQEEVQSQSSLKIKKSNLPAQTKIIVLKN